jgi:hypothetical protein
VYSSDDHLSQHAEIVDKQSIQKLHTESQKQLVSTQEVTACTGAELERWKLAAEAELTKNFLDMGAMHVSTPDERARHGKPLPMLCVWTRADDLYKCRACVCGNFAEVDPTQQSWTAQAEPSSLLAAVKMARVKNWLTSKHDVKGAFLNAEIPQGRIVIVSPPPLWVKWGLVPAGVTWTLDKAVYGLRESPHLWGKKRDKVLKDLIWTISGHTEKRFQLQQCAADSQVWCIKEVTCNNQSILGILVVYVDDFLLQMAEGEVRTALLDALSKQWKLAKEVILTTVQPLTFLGIEFVLQSNGDLRLHQTQFINQILDKYGMSVCNSIKSVQMAMVPSETDPPTPSNLKKTTGIQW